MDTKKAPAQKGKDPMVIRSLSVNLDLWKEAQDKAGLAPISAIIRALLRKWIRGEIELSAEDTEEK